MLYFIEGIPSIYPWVSQVLAVIDDQHRPVLWSRSRSVGLRMTAEQADAMLQRFAMTPPHSPQVWAYRRIEAGFGWVADHDHESRWLESDICGSYQAFISSAGARIIFRGWAGITIMLADSEYLTPPRYLNSHDRRETWDDYAAEQMTWCEERLLHYLTHGHTAQDITCVSQPNMTSLPWACSAHQTETVYHHHIEVACPACQVRYNQRKAHN